MRAELPQVVTLQLPPDDEIESLLSHLWTFDKATVTDEDARRTSMYREDVARQELKESTTDLAEFIASLGLAVDVAPLEDSEWPRAAQLTQRTNQFNFTTVRRTEPEIRALAGSGSTVLRVKVRDRFGDYGLAGLVIVDEIEDELVVDTLLLSCRVLGRGVEHAVLRRLGEIARQRALRHIHLPYVPTSKNEPARAFSESVAANFRAQEQNRIVYRIPIEDACAIENRPVIDAHKSEENKSSVSSDSMSSVDRSERYAKFGQALLSGRSGPPCRARLRCAGTHLAWRGRSTVFFEKARPPGQTPIRGREWISVHPARSNSSGPKQTQESRIAHSHLDIFEGADTE
jgi:hypothetical protein